METFSALLAICATNSPVTGEFPAQRPVTRIFDNGEAGDLRRHRAHYDVIVIDTPYPPMVSTNPYGVIFAVANSIMYINHVSTVPYPSRLSTGFTAKYDLSIREGGVIDGNDVFLFIRFYQQDYNVTEHEHTI